MLPHNEQICKYYAGHLNTFGIYQVSEWKGGKFVLVDLADALSDVDVIYGSPRVSTDAQAQTGYSKDIVQQQDCMYFSELLGKSFECHDVYHGESGRTSQQAYLLDTLVRAREHGRAAVMRWSLNRILRPTLTTSNRLDTKHLAKLASYRVPILAAMPFDAPDDVLRSRMSKMIAAYKRQRGEQYAQTTFVPDDASPLMLQLHGEGLSLRDIADRLNRQGMTTKKGKAWSGKQVQRVLAYLEREGINSRQQLAMYHLQQAVTEGLNTSSASSASSATR